MIGFGQAEGGEPRELSDGFLLAELARQETRALGILYDRYGRLAYGLAYQMLRDATAAEDVVQEAFLSVWSNARRFDPARGSVRVWLLTMVRRRCIDILRGRRRRVEVDDLDDILEQSVPTDDVWETVLQKLEAQDVRRALASLPEEQRTTIQLAFFKGLTHAQIATQMNVPLGTVKGRLRLALDKLRLTLTPPNGSAPLTEV